MPWVDVDSSDAAGFHSMFLQSHRCMCVCERHTEWDEAEHTPCQCDREWVFQSKRSAPSSLPSLSLSLCSSSFFSGSTDTLSLSSSSSAPAVFCSSGCSLYRSISLSIPPSLPAAFIVWTEGWAKDEWRLMDWMGVFSLFWLTHGASLMLPLSPTCLFFLEFSRSRIIYEWAEVNESTGLSSCRQRMSRICKERERKIMRGESIYWVKDIMMERSINSLSFWVSRKYIRRLTSFKERFKMAAFFGKYVNLF